MDERGAAYRCGVGSPSSAVKVWAIGTGSGHRAGSHIGIMCYTSVMLAGSQRAKRKAQTREQLIESAARVFVEHGYHGASLALVADEAGFTTGAIYTHFEGKDELFLAVYERFARARADQLATDLDGDGDLATRARAAADRWSAHHEQQPAFTLLALEFAVHALRHPQLRTALAAHHATVRQAAANALEQHAAGTALPLPAEQLATVLRELGVGLSLAQLIDPDAVPHDLYGAFVEHYFRTLLGTTA